jgi:transposase-like protein
MEAAEPKTLQEAIVYFSNPENCLNYLVPRRWPNGVVCPSCGSEKVSFLKNHLRWQCSSHHAKRQFSVKVGTIFEDSPLGLDKWLPCVWLITNCKNGVSSYEVSRALGVTQKTAWFMLHRVRLAMQDKESGGKLSGEVEIDETYIGGSARNMHKDVRKRRLEHQRGPSGKAIVMGMLERKGRVRARVVQTNATVELQPHVRSHIEAGAQIFTDSHAAYRGMAEYEHHVVDHAVCYVEGNVHTNGLENFWSLLKRGIGGTYVSVEPFHLFRYVDEQAFRFNNRKDMNDGDRFDLAVRQIVGKRLTYAELTGKVGETETIN